MKPTIDDIAQALPYLENVSKAASEAVSNQQSAFRITCELRDAIGMLCDPNADEQAAINKAIRACRIARVAVGDVVKDDTALALYALGHRDGEGMFDGVAFEGVIVASAGFDSLKVLTASGEKVIRSELFKKIA